jgi:hypothetical protein
MVTINVPIWVILVFASAFIIHGSINLYLFYQDKKTKRLDEEIDENQAYNEFSKTDRWHHTKMDYGTFDYIWQLAKGNIKQ